MKKIIFFLMFFTMFYGTAYAFDIDINKVSVSSKADNLINNLNTSYNIETDGFSSELINDENITKIVKEAVKVTFSSKTTDEKRKEFTKYMFYSSDDGSETLSGKIFVDIFLEKINDYKIDVEYIKDIRTVTFNDDDAMSFVYFDNALVDDDSKDIVLAFWLKKNNNEYGIYYPWITIDDELDSYYKSVTKDEENGEYIGGTYNKVSLSGNGEVAVNEGVLEKIYQDNKNSVVQITGMSNGGKESYGSGFFIREGVVATTWSLFLEMLNNSDFIYVNDCSGNTYDILGIVTAKVDYDIVILKINSNSGKGVEFGKASNLKLDDKLFMINSKNNNTFSINYGSFISLDNGKLKNLFLLNESDVGSALFNENGEVVGFAIGDKINSELSYGNSTDYLIKLQNILNNQGYSSISYTLLETFKQDYYINVESEKSYNKVPDEIWKNYGKIGDLGNKINLPLIKASYVDDIVSLRYRNDTDNLLDSMYLVSDFTDSLIKDGFEFTYSDEYKKIYKSNKYKIVIKESLNYLIIIIMEN